MPQERSSDFLTKADYLKAEENSEIKHEYVNGKIYAMAGASPNHCKLTGNFARLLGNYLIDSPCYPYSSDMKIKTSTGSYRYPDVTVVCDDNFIDNGLVTKTPTIIVEVISRSTRKIDEQDKLMEYINIPSLQEYVLVEQDFVDITVYRKSDEWRSKHYFLEQTIHFESIDITLKVEDIYHRVNNQDMIDFLEK